MRRHHGNQLADQASARRPANALSAGRPNCPARADAGGTLDEGPIVYCEDYSIYLIIDFCIRHYLRSGIGTDVVYLVHPAIIELTRYDAEHRSDLRDVLYRFLLCDRSLAKTADAAFMHRNTVLNKITKVESMLGIDLNDARLRQKLILSCQIILYIENVLQRSLGIPED